MLSHFRGHIFAAAMAMLGATSLGSPSLAAEKIKIGFLKTSLNGPMYIAVEKGYFAAEGLDADFVFFDAAQPVAVAVVSGDIQFGAAALTAGLYALGGQGALRIIASQGFEAPGFSAQAIVASNRAYYAGLTSFTALPGHSVAVTQIGSGSHYSLILVAEKYGLDLKSILVLPLQSVSNVTSAVVGGQADAAVNAVNSIARAIDHQDVKLLGYDGDVARWSFGAVFSATKFANQRPDTVERFLRAFRKGARDYHDAFTGTDEKRVDGPTAPEILAIITRHVEQPPDTIRTALAYVDPEARVDVNDIKRQIAWFQSQGMLKGDVNSDAIIDARYAVPLLAQP